MEKNEKNQNKKITISDLWSNINISTILLLKLFEDICNKTYDIKNKQNVMYPIHYIAYEYGLLTCMISEDSTKLKLIFDYNICTSDLKLTKSNYYNFIDRLISSKYFHSIDNKYIQDDTIPDYNKILIVSLNIPIKYLEDINMIKKTSKYSLVSDIFKEKMNNNFSKNSSDTIIVPVIINYKSKFIVLNSLPFNIVNKGLGLKKIIEERLGVDEKTPYIIKDSHEIEYYIKWEDKNEIFNYEKLNKYVGYKQE